MTALKEGLWIAHRSERLFSSFSWGGAGLVWFSVCLYFGEHRHHPTWFGGEVGLGVWMNGT